MTRRHGNAPVATLLAALTVACGSAARSVTTEAAPAPTAATAAVAPASSADTLRPRNSAGDVSFMQGMIAHHAQALAMTSLVPGRTTRPEIRLIAERIEVSQTDEIALMRGWLERRGEAVPSPDASHEHHAAAHAALMPGMLTPAELDELTAATGADFDRLFLRYMIRHHEGALTMVAQLLATRGAGQDTETFLFASDVDADQRAEIRRMRALEASLAAAPSRR